MSRVSAAKEAQGYTTRKRDCGRCRHFRFKYGTDYHDRKVMKMIRCGIGGFKVMLTGTCDRWKAAE